MTRDDEPLPFEQAQDVELGSALRAALDGPVPEAFLARLRAAVAEREDSWDVLSRWAPWGVAAAAAAAVAAWFLLRPMEQPAPATLIAASAPVQMEAAPHQSESDVLVVSFLEGR